MSDVRKTCPWCGRKGLTWAVLKRHVKFCDRAPRPRGRALRKRVVHCSSGKAQHFSKESASRHMAKLAEMSDGGAVPLNVYRCPECHFYHVGRAPQAVRAQFGLDRREPQEERSQ